LGAELTDMGEFKEGGASLAMRGEEVEVVVDDEDAAPFFS